MKYDEVRPIEPRTCTAYLVTFEDGSKNLQLWAANTPIEAIREQIIALSPDAKFTVGNPWLGHFDVSNIDHSYYADGRCVDQDLNVRLT